MRRPPGNTIAIVDTSAGPVPCSHEQFAAALVRAFARMRTACGGLSPGDYQPYAHISTTHVVLTSYNDALAEAVRSDMRDVGEGRTQVVLTWRWGPQPGDMETLTAVWQGGVLVVMWLGEDAHRTVVSLSAALTGRCEVCGAPSGQHNVGFPCGGG